MNSLTLKYLSVRKQTLALCEPLQTEDYVPQPIEDVSPPKWHLGHTTWFFEVFLLKKFLPGYQTFHPDYHFIFNSYYESQGVRIIRAQRGNLSRPTLAEIISYRTYVDEHMEQLLTRDVVLEKQFNLFFEIGLNHEEQHQELLVYDFKFILGHNPLFPVYRKQSNVVHQTKAVNEQWLKVDEGLYSTGHNASEKFCYDNEMPAHKNYLKSFRIRSALVTNGEFLEFVASGAYQNWEFWLEEGWKDINQHKISKPLYWHKPDNDWYYYTLGGLIKLDLNAPVSHINYYEAEAFARWKGCRLPTETEWEVACKLHQPQAPLNANLLDSGQFETRAARENNYQFWGDGWEWTQSAYLPYPGYKQDKGALGEYNGKFMINQMVLKGGSYATWKHHVRSSYRNFFHPQKRWMISSFRLVKS